MNIAVRMTTPGYCVSFLHFHLNDIKIYLLSNYFGESCSFKISQSSKSNIFRIILPEALPSYKTNKTRPMALADSVLTESQ